MGRGRGGGGGGGGGGSVASSSGSEGASAVSSALSQEPQAAGLIRNLDSTNNRPAGTAEAELAKGAQSAHDKLLAAASRDQSVTGTKLREASSYITKRELGTSSKVSVFLGNDAVERIAQNIAVSVAGKTGRSARYGG